MLSQSMRVVVVVALAAAPSSVRAQSAAEAEQLFHEGDRLMGEKKYAEACAAYEASEHLDGNPVTLWKLADCREKNGQLASAWGHFTSVAHRTRGDAGRATVHRTATARAAALAPRLSYLTIDVPEASRIPGLIVVRNGASIEPGAWSTALPVDGGSFTIVATAPGHASSSTTVAIAESGERKTVQVPTLVPLAPSAEVSTAPRPEPAEPRPPARVTPDDPDESDEPEVDDQPRRSRALPIALGGAAAVSLGAAVGLELWARSTYDDAKAELDDARQDDLWRSAKTRRYAAQGVAAAGVGLAVAATWLLLRGDGDERAETARVTPVVEASGTGVAVGLGGAW